MHLPLRAALGTGLVLLALACGGAPTEAPPPEPVVAAPSPAPEPAPERAGKHRKAGKHKSKAADPDDPVAAYLADCHAVFPPAEAEEMDEGTDDECRWRPFDQNCAPDTFGCWDQGQRCRDACGEACGTCQDSCAESCDGCKERCGGERACERACAEARSSCRDACLGSKPDCQDDCLGAEHACYRDADTKKKEKCPDCAALTTCLYRKMERQEPTSACLDEHPGNAPECLEWCYEQ